MTLADYQSCTGYSRRLNRHAHSPWLLQQGSEGRRVRPVGRRLANPDRSRPRTSLRYSIPTSDHARKQEIPTIWGAQHAQDLVALFVSHDHGVCRQGCESAQYGCRLQRNFLPREECINRRSTRCAANSRRADEDIHDLFQRVETSQAATWHRIMLVSRRCCLLRSQSQSVRTFVCYRFLQRQNRI